MSAPFIDPLSLILVLFIFVPVPLFLIIIGRMRKRNNNELRDLQKETNRLLAEIVSILKSNP